MKLRAALVVGAVTLSIACAGAPQRRSAEPSAPPAAEARFTILQINDVYKVEGLEGGRVGGLARVRTLRRQLEAEGRPVLVLHAGDLLFPSVMSKYLRAAPMIRVLNLLDGDPAAFDPRLFVVFGNHEFDDRDPGVLLGRVAQSDFSWVSSNTRYRTVKSARGEPLSARLANVHETVVRDVGGIQVGILGLTTDTQPRDYVAYEYELPERQAAVERALARLRDGGARVVLALTHQDLDEDERLARDFPAIGIVIGGHEHFFLQRRVGKTWITKADADARTAIVHDVRVAPDGSVRASAGCRSSGVEKDPRSRARCRLARRARLRREAQTWLDLRRSWGNREHPEGIEPACRPETRSETFEDVIRERMKPTSLRNGGAIRINDDFRPARSETTISRDLLLRNPRVFRDHGHTAPSPPRPSRRSTQVTVASCRCRTGSATGWRDADAPLHHRSLDVEVSPPCRFPETRPAQPTPRPRGDVWRTIPRRYASSRRATTAEPERLTPGGAWRATTDAESAPSGPPSPSKVEAGCEAVESLNDCKALALVPSVDQKNHPGGTARASNEGFAVVGSTPASASRWGSSSRGP